MLLSRPIPGEREIEILYAYLKELFVVASKLLSVTLPEFAETYQAPPA